MLKHKLFSLLLCSILLLSFATNVWAAETTGTLKVTIVDTKTQSGIKDAVVRIYQVAKIVNGNYVITDAFSESEFDVSIIGDLTASSNKTEAKRLSEYVTSKNISSVRVRQTNSSGVVNFGDATKPADNPPIDLGLYLVVQTVSPTGHTAIAPFLITVPQVESSENGETVYDYTVDAKPKAGTSDPTTSTTTPSTTTPSGGYTGGSLAQTGQLWWPVYLMSGVGLVLFVYGWLRRRSEANA